MTFLQRCRQVRRKQRHRERGQAAVEIALMLPILVTLLVGIVNIGDAANSHITVVAATRDGARLASKTGISTSVNQLVITDMSRLRGSIAPGDISVTQTSVAGNPAAKVRACYRHSLLITYPLLPLPNPIVMCKETTMRIL